MITLDESYRRCRALHRRYGTTYFWATYALPAMKRPHVHALYGFCRYADEIVDSLDGTPADIRATALDDLHRRLFDDLGAGASDHPILRAVVHTIRAFDIEPEAFGRFLRSMAMDLTVATYQTYDDLRRYTDGSAAVIGEMMLPILEPIDPKAAHGPARDLGEAFQLTNFLRDIGDDLDRGRVYVPLEDVRRFEAEDAFGGRRVTVGFIELMRFEIDRTRRLYSSADAGIELLPPASARCVRSARILYAAILDRIEANGYDVFGRRARVPTTRKLATVATEVVRG
jgi:15-cis-phytoene synthase